MLTNEREHVNFFLPKPLVSFIRKEAEADDRSVNNTVERILKKYKEEKETS